MGAEEEYFDEDAEPDPEFRRVTNRIIGAAIAVHRELGPGYDEQTYERALTLEFLARGIQFHRQIVIDVWYRGEKVGEKKLDFLVEGTVVVELKAVVEFNKIFISQVISYLKATKKRLGIIINFNVKKLIEGVQRVIY